MKQLLFALFFMFISVAGVSAQEIKVNSIYTSYLKVNGSVQQYANAYDQLLNMMHKRYPKTNDNAGGWKFLKENKDKAVDEMIVLLGVVYKKHFSIIEIDEMLGFYRSKAGRQLLSDRTKMTDTQKKELNAYYNSSVGKKVISKKHKLGKEIGIVSEGWSRDLYETALSLLK